jgi:hypothetical protein
MVKNKAGKEYFGRGSFNQLVRKHLTEKTTYE